MQPRGNQPVVPDGLAREETYHFGAGCLVAWFLDAGCLVARLLGCLVAWWLGAWLLGCLVARLLGGLVAWLLCCFVVILQ